MSEKLTDYDISNGEEWLRELYKVITFRRNAMFRLIAEAVRTLMLGNAGGAAMIIGFISGTNSGNESYHSAAIITLIIFLLGVLFSALCTVVIAAVAVKEAHGAEEALRKFSLDEISRQQTIFYIGGKTLKLADLATLFGLIAAILLAVGILIGIILLAVFF